MRRIMYHAESAARETALHLAASIGKETLKVRVKLGHEGPFLAPAGTGRKI